MNTRGESEARIRRTRASRASRVSIRDREEMGGVNGVAYSSAQRARPIPEGKPEDRAIVMAISKQLDPIKKRLG